MFVLKINLIILVSYLMFFLEHSPLILFFREMLKRDLPKKDRESSTTTSLTVFLHRTVPDVCFSPLKGKLPLKMKTLSPNVYKGQEL